MYSTIKNLGTKAENRFPFTKFIWNFLRRINYWRKDVWLQIDSAPRRLGFIDKRFIYLKKLANRHEGKRCFIVATGPSLTIDDLELIKDEYTLSMNSIILSYDKTDFRAMYYGIQDRNVYEKIYDKLMEYQDESMVFYPYSWRREIWKKPIPKRWHPLPLNGWYHMYDFNYTNRIFAKFSDDLYKIVYDGYTITYTMIQIAIYLGFKEIYLLGCDSTYSLKREDQHFIDYGLDVKIRENVFDHLSTAYLEAKKYAERHNIKIYNATRGGRLEVFERVNLEDLFKK